MTERKPKKMTKQDRNVCLVCNKSPFANNVTLHRIPTRESTRLKWMEVLNLNANDKLTSVRVCSEHFHDKYYRYNNNVKTKFLIPNAYPTLNLECDDIFDELDIKEDIIQSKIVDPSPSENVTAGTSDEPSDIPMSGEIEDIVATYVQPRFVGDLNISHFMTTPLHAKMVYHLVSQTYVKQQTEIKRLKRRNNYLQMKLAGVEASLENLKDELRGILKRSESRRSFLNKE